ncbi:hypothetical protein BH10BAC1_BH10BAC1_06860 [soil metagenome]
MLLKQIRFFILFILLASSFNAFSQDEPLPVPPQAAGDTPPAKKQYYLLSPRLSITVPHPMGNKSFKKSFVGIYEVSGGLNVMLYKGFFLGVSGKNGLLKITENKIADYNASMTINNVCGKFGVDTYVGEKNNIIYSVALSYGQNWTKYSGIKYKDANNPPKINGFTTSYFEPEMNLFFLIESNFAIGATISYTIFDAHFDPYDLRLNEYTPFDTKNAASTQFLSFGFGFYYSLIKKKK